jgi:alpha-ketoglutarate-dependent taurine dioxygenase
MTMRAGDLVVFDNHRILHGRTPFTGPRHLQGCLCEP